MKRILAITISKVSVPFDNGIYTSLYKELGKNNTLDIITFGAGEDEVICVSKNITLYRLKSDELFKVSKIRKAINQLKLNRKVINYINRNFNDSKFDLILYSTPPITLNKSIIFAKKKYNAKTYLLLKDIFPQNAVDLNLFSKKGLIYRYFRSKEKKLYKISDYIGCMSLGNQKYLLENNKIDKEKVEVNPNSIEIIQTKHTTTKNQREEILKKYSIPEGKTLFVYGGNLGIPQGINFINKVIKANEATSNFIVIVGEGTEKNKLINFIQENNIKNSIYINKIPKSDYNDLLKYMDVGLIFLDSRFTIPNIPSRLLSYLEFSKPVIAAIDKTTDLKDWIEKGNFGFWCESTNEVTVIELFEKIKKVNRIQKLGTNGRNYLENHFDVRITSNLILDKIYEVKNV